FTHGIRHVSLASLDEDDRVFTAFSLSKTYAMTGVRVGYLVTPKGLGATMRTTQEAMISCVAEPDQWAALAAIVGDDSAVQDARGPRPSSRPSDGLEARGGPAPRLQTVRHRLQSGGCDPQVARGLRAAAAQPWENRPTVRPT